MLWLKPSGIRYSQDSINNYFDAKCNHSHKMIGETLDDICNNQSSISDIPSILVVLQDGHWTTADNRRLWVFRQLERLGKCDEIPVRQGHYIPEAKLTSINDGESVRVRGSPGGLWHKKPAKTAHVTKPVTPSKPSPQNIGYSIPTPPQPIKTYTSTPDRYTVNPYLDRISYGTGNPYGASQQQRPKQTSIPKNVVTNHGSHTQSYMFNRDRIYQENNPSYHFRDLSYENRVPSRENVPVTITRNYNAPLNTTTAEPAADRPKVYNDQARIVSSRSDWGVSPEESSNNSCCVIL